MAAAPILHGTGVPLVLGGSGRTQDETAWITAPSQRVHLLEDRASGQAEARVITLEPRGLATIRTLEGATYEVVKCTTWRVGDTVACEHTARTRVPWETLDCRKTS